MTTQEPTVRGTLEGKGRTLDATAPGRLGLRGAAWVETATVQAQAVAYTVGGTVAMGGFPALSLRLQPMVDSGGRLHGGAQPHGTALAIWEGSVPEAERLAGCAGPVLQASALLAAERRLAKLRRDLEASEAYADAQAATRAALGAKKAARAVA